MIRFDSDLKPYVRLSNQFVEPYLMGILIQKMQMNLAIVKSDERQTLVLIQESPTESQLLTYEECKWLFSLHEMYFKNICKLFKHDSTWINSYVSVQSGEITDIFCNTNTLVYLIAVALRLFISKRFVNRYSLIG